MSWHYGFRPYVPVAQRQAYGKREVAKLVKKGQKVSPVCIDGRAITSTFWGKAWCTNLESYSDFANRLPRGRTYVRNGSVVHLEIAKGRIKALVSGSKLYEITIDISALPSASWQSLKMQCAGKIGSLVELLQGKLSKSVMELVTNPNEGMFPKPKEIKMRCSCPDYAGMCKHLAAVMYGIGNRLDSAPELLFVLRGIDHLELLEHAIPTGPVSTCGKKPAIAADSLSELFDIELDDTPTPAAHPPAAEKAKTAKKPAAKKGATNTSKVKDPSASVEKSKPSAPATRKRLPKKG